MVSMNQPGQHALTLCQRQGPGAVQQPSTATTATGRDHWWPTSQSMASQPIFRDPRFHHHASAGAACSGRRNGSVAEAGGGTARHTRAWSVGAPAVVADCRRLRFVPQPCQIPGSATVNSGDVRSSCQPPHQVSKPQVSSGTPQPLS
jgi:hypothetical protein